MPWRESTKMTERVKLIEKWKSKVYSVTELAEEFGISRPSVYHWIERYEDEGDKGLIDRPPVPKSCPHKTDAQVAEQIVQAKARHSLWGPEKLIALLSREKPDVDWPAASTAGRILDERGLVKKRRARRTGVVRHGQQLEANESGEMMTADHKGQIRMGNGKYCYPVTINEPVSRYIYAIEGKDSTSYENARRTFERVFREHGIPYFMGTDNGNPFCCSRALAGLSRMSVWWIKQRITPLTIHKGCPWENGIHERMHRTLKEATARPPGQNKQQQQQMFEAFRQEFNNVRPHASLGGRTPSSALKPCKRPYPERVPSVEYPLHYETRSVRSKGSIKWKGRDLFVSQSLIGERVGLTEIDDGVWSLYFSNIELGRWNERTKSIS